MSKRMVDAVINLDGLILEDGESLDDVCELIKENYSIGYEMVYEVTYEEKTD